MEKYTFCTARFPIVSISEHLTPFFSPAQTSTAPADTANPPPPRPSPPSENLIQQFRATLARFSSILPRLSPLPADCTFTLAIEIRENADAPVGVKVGNRQPWIVAEPAVQADGVQRLQQQHRRKNDWDDEIEEDGETGVEGVGRGLKAVRSMPLRSLADGEFVLEVWVEEGKGKFGGEQEVEPRLP